MTSDTLSLLGDLVAKAKAAGADAADAVAVSGDSLSIDWRGGKLEQVDRSEGADIGLRVLIGRRQAAASTSDPSLKAMAALVERVVAMAKVAPEDPTAGLADPSQLATVWPDLELEDANEPSVGEIQARAAAAEDAMLAVPGVSKNSERGRVLGPFLLVGGCQQWRFCQLPAHWLRRYGSGAGRRRHGHGTRLLYAPGRARR